MLSFVDYPCYSRHHYHHVRILLLLLLLLLVVVVVVVLITFVEVFKNRYLERTMSLRHMFQLFCGYSLWYMQSYSTVIPVAQRSKVWGSGSSLVGSNPTGGQRFLSPIVLCAGRGVCDGPITRTEESYRVWCVCDRGTSQMRPRPIRATKPRESYFTWEALCKFN